MPWQQVLADVVLVAHFSVVVFVVGGLLLIVAGNLLSWSWVNALWFRLLHVTAIGVVVAEAWVGLTCPLTTLESWLRSEAGAAPYSGSFIAHWVQRVLFYDIPASVFTVAYTVFGVLVLGVWWYFPPRRGKHNGGRF